MSDSNEYYDRLANAELQRRQAAVDAARADERARIVAWMDSQADHLSPMTAQAWKFGWQAAARAIERGEFDDLAASDE